MPSLPTPGVTTSWGDDLNAAIESLHLTGTHAARPSTDLTTGTLYSCTDHLAIYRWSGSAWVAWTEPFVGCKVKRVAAYTMASVTMTAIPWDGEDYDTHGFHDNTTNNTRLTIPAGQAGVYLLTGVWVPDNPLTAGTRALIRFFKNGVEVLGSEIEGGGVNASPVLAGFMQLAVGDYVQMSYYISAASVALYTPPTGFAIQKVGAL